jgi:hypothetical protein
VQDCLPWLSQGDIFESVPLIFADGVTEAGEIRVEQRPVPALLITHGCVLDKATNSGVPAIKRLSFLPLTAVEAQDRGRQAALRKGGTAPYEVLYLGDCGPAGESFVVLSEVTYLPAAYFDPYLDPWTGHERAGVEDRYLTLGRNSARFGRVDDNVLNLLLDKMNLFWTRREAVLA